MNRVKELVDLNEFRQALIKLDSTWECGRGLCVSLGDIYKTINDLDVFLVEEVSLCQEQNK